MFKLKLFNLIEKRVYKHLLEETYPSEALTLNALAVHYLATDRKIDCVLTTFASNFY